MTSTDDLIPRLRSAHQMLEDLGYENGTLHSEAADRLTALQDRVNELEEALITIRDKRSQCNRAADCQAVARAVLAKGEKG